jgi:tripartite ATP-independent transporter DctP family solute receptor
MSQAQITRRQFTKYATLAATGLATVPILDACAQSTPAGPKKFGSKVTFKMATISQGDFPYNLGVKDWMARLEKEAPGAFDFQFFPASQLGDEGTIEKGIIAGSIHGGVAAGAWGGFVPAYSTVELPFIINDLPHMYKLADGKFGEKLTSLAEAKGFKILAYYSTGTFQLETRTKPVRNLSDFKAMKVRIVPNAATTAGVQALGAVPVPIALNQVYTSLQQGTVEGATNDVLTVSSQHFYEVEKYMTIMDILCEPRPVITSKAFFDSLDKDHQDILLSTCKASAIFERKNFEDQLKAGTDTLTKNGIQIVQLEDRPKWVDAVRPVWRQFANQDPDSAALIKLLEQSQ